jgi:hypothetical protein
MDVATGNTISFGTNGCLKVTGAIAEDSVLVNAVAGFGDVFGGSIC